MSLPIFRGSSAAIYPFTMTISFLTGVTEFQDGSQQRSVKRPGGPLVKFEIPYPALTIDQKNTLLAAITSAKGQQNTGLSLLLGGVTYANLSLDSDDFTATEAQTMQYDCPLKLTQTVSQIAPGAPGSAFPVLANGAIGQLAYAQKKRFQTIAAVMETGPKFTTAEYAGGFTGYPTDGLKAWEFNEQKLSDADLATRVTHFQNQWGRAYAFTFTDEDSNAYAKTHYAMDDLAINYLGPNEAAVRIMLEATN